MWLTPGASEAAAADQRLRAATPATQPRWALRAIIWQVGSHTFLVPKAFPRGLVWTAGSAWTRSTIPGHLARVFGFLAHHRGSYLEFPCVLQDVVATSRPMRS